jgi:hypothetical protein
VNKVSKIAVAAALALSTFGCSNEPVMRVVTLHSKLALPSGSSSFAGSALAIEFDGVEPLHATHKYIAWAETDTAFLPLGAVHGGERLVADIAELGASPSDVHSAFVTVEAHDASLDAGPSSLGVVRGPAPGPLDIRGAAEGDFPNAAGEVTLMETQVTARVSGLPQLPRALEYGVWVHESVVAPSGGHNDAHALAEGHDEGPASASPEVTMRYLGALDASGNLAVSSTVLNRAHGVTITIEALAGSRDISSVTVLEGNVELPEGASGGHGDEDAHLH